MVFGFRAGARFVRADPGPDKKAGGTSATIVCCTAPLSTIGLRSAGDKYDAVDNGNAETTSAVVGCGPDLRLPFAKTPVKYAASPSSGTGSDPHGTHSSLRGRRLAPSRQRAVDPTARGKGP